MFQYKLVAVNYFTRELFAVSVMFVYHEITLWVREDMSSYVGRYVRFFHGFDSIVV